ncbi:MAG: hypothetical protein R3D67_02110 [Hyphomicrobiaceae bacterium]
MNTLALYGIVAYVVLQFAIGVWVSRRVSSDQDYIIAGRSLGLGLVAFSVFATWFGAEAIVASAGEIYAHGLAGGLIDPFGYGLAVLVVGLLLAGPLWRRGIVTYADMIRDRYSGNVEKLFVIVLLPGSLFWAAAQIGPSDKFWALRRARDCRRPFFWQPFWWASIRSWGGCWRTL